MCCFTGPVAHVSSTNIFARAFADGRQLVAYGMTVGLPSDVAMVLPIPVPARSPNDAVSFVDMSSAPTFFDDLSALFRSDFAAGFGPPPQAHASLALAVHAVGDFEASFVPTIGDFARLDPRFRFSDEVWRALPEYRDWGFAVFKLRHMTGMQRVHPMAFTFPRRDADALFFPTVHVHDGAVHERAAFDHTLYCQVERDWDPLMASARATEPTSSLPIAARAFVDEAAPLYRDVLKGELPNDDVWLRGSVLRDRTFVSAYFRVRVHAGDALRGSERRRVTDAVAAIFEREIAARGGAWGLIPFRDDLPLVHPDAYLGGAFPRPSTPQGCLVTVFEYAQTVMGVGLTVAFAAPPSAETTQALRTAFRAAIAAIGG